MIESDLLFNGIKVLTAKHRIPHHYHQDADNGTVDLEGDGGSQYCLRVVKHGCAAAVEGSRDS